MYHKIVSGELGGTVSAAAMPDIGGLVVMFKAAYDNAGRVYIGGAGVTKADGTTDVTTGIQLSAGETFGWVPFTTLKNFYYICDNAGDDLTYMIMKL